MLLDSETDKLENEDELEEKESVKEEYATSSSPPAAILFTSSCPSGRERLELVLDDYWTREGESPVVMKASGRERGREIKSMPRIILNAPKQAQIS